MIGCAAAGLVLALLPAARQEPVGAAADWEELFAALRGLEEQPPGPERRLGLELLKEAAVEHAGDPRGRVLRAHVARLGGEALPALALTLVEIEALPAEPCWRAAEVLAPGDGQDAALARALALLPEKRVAVAFIMAYERVVALDESHRTLEAHDLATALHARARAGWSASNLAMLARRLGRTAEAVQVLSLQLERAAEGPEVVALLQDRALAWLGGGFEARARADLGASMARGSPDAAVVLGRLALGSGSMERARAVLRPLLRTHPPQAWALRGWGLSMLPAKRARL